MKHINILASIALAAFTLTSCQQDLNHNMVPDKLGFAYTENLQQPSVFKAGMSVSVIKSGKGSDAATVEIEACSQEELDQWRTANGYETALLQASELNYSIKMNVKSLYFAASDIRKSFEVEWKTSFFANSARNGKDYVIALKLVNPSIEADENRSILIIRPILSHVSFKHKDVKTVFPTLDDVQSINKYEGEINMDFAVTSEDVILELCVDNSLIAQEAAAREKEFEAAPEGLFSFIDQKVTIPAGETIAHFGFQLDLSVLFDSEGQFLQSPANYMIPITVSKKSPELLGLGNTSTTCVLIYIAEDDVVVPPSSPSSIIHGPWEILEGADQHIGNDPACKQPDWYKNYNTDRLVDWRFGNSSTDATANGYWGSYFWTDPTFPMVFVFDTGGEYIFESFHKVDASAFQGQFRDFEVYVARSYAGNDTDWKLAAKGRTGDLGWQAYPSGAEVDIEDVLKRFSYIIPEDPEAEGSEMNYTRGRYIKFCIMNTMNKYPTSSKGGYLMEFYAKGWAQ